jgi:hypothetical protein
LIDHILDLRARVRLRHTLSEQRGEWQQRIQATLYHHVCPQRRQLMTGDGRDWLGVVITSAPPFIVEKVKKRSWIIARPDPVLVDTETSSTGALKLAQPASRPLDANDGDVAGVRSDRHDRTPPA